MKLQNDHVDIATDGSITTDGNIKHKAEYQDSFGFLRTALTGVTVWTDRQIRNTGVVVPHIAKGDVFSYNVQFNHNKELATNLADFHIHFMPVSNPAGNENIRIAYAWGFYNFNEAIPDTLPNTGNADIPLVAGDQYKHKLGDVVLNMSTGSEMYSGFFLIKCTRVNDANDTYAGEIALLGADSHFQVTKAGSKARLNDTV